MFNGWKLIPLAVNEFEFLFCDFQTAVVPHVSLDIHHADFGKLLDPNAVEQKVTAVKQFLNYQKKEYWIDVISSGINLYESTPQ